MTTHPVDHRGQWSGGDVDTVMMRAVSLSAPPEQVWPWLVQMGEGRGGFYGYDRLEHTFGDNQ